MPRSLIWISGATRGLGLGLARTVPYPDARVISLSRQPHPELETVHLDLTRPETWEAVGRHFAETLDGFAGERAIFLMNAVHGAGVGYVGEVDRQDYLDTLFGNYAAPLALAESFLRAVDGKPIDSGVVLLSSASARHPYEGQATYCAAKAGLEMWVRVVRRELKSRGRRSWVAAVRPGFVDTPLTRSYAALPAEVYPAGPELQAQFATGENVLRPEDAARQIWRALPPGDVSLLSFGEMVGAAARSGGPT